MFIQHWARRWMVCVVAMWAGAHCGGPTRDAPPIVTTIEGTVRDAETSQVIEGASISTDPATESVTTGVEGRYRISARLELGKQYRVIAQRPGYEQASVTVVVQEGSNSAGDITLEATGPRSPQLFVDPLTIDLGSATSAEQFTLRNTGPGDLQYTIYNPPQPWLTLDGPLDGTVSSQSRVVNFRVARAGLAAGSHSTRIRITSNGGDATVTVSMAVVASASGVEIDGRTSASVGESSQLVARCIFTDATESPCSSPVWESSSPSVASVSSSGLVQALSPGVSTIAASQGTVRGTVDFVVANRTLTSIVLSGPGSCPVGGSAQLQAECRYSDGTSAGCASPSWSSLDPSRATIDASGVARCVAAGTVQIQAAVGPLTSGAFDLVIQNPAPVLSAITPSSVAAGSAAFTMTLSGSGFVPASEVRLSGSAVTAVYTSATELSAMVPASAIASAGTVQVTVVNPAPGGGSSSRSLEVPASSSDDCRALGFDGVDDRIIVPDVPSTPAFTIEAWVRGAPGGASAGLFATKCGLLAWSSSGFGVDIYPSCSGTGTRYFTANPIAFSAFPSAWYHIAMVVPAQDQVQIYVNGQLAGSSSGLAFDNGVNSTTEGAVAAWYRGSANPATYSRVDVASFRVSNAARYGGAFTPERTLTTDASTVILYDLEEGSGTSVSDRSGSGRNGSVVGGATWIAAGPGPSCAGESGCADGSDELGPSAFGGSDIVLCGRSGAPSSPLRLSQGASADCGSGWHVCTASEFTARNDAFDPTTGDFVATVDDGDDCFAMNLFYNPNYRGNSDAIRSGFSGSCTGAASGSAWGRQQYPSCEGTCGVLCCR